jgi:hypothetical protein
VEVEMGDGFAAVGAVIDHDAESVFGVAFLSCNRAYLEKEVAEEGLVILFRKGDAGEGLFWNEKKVDGGLR